MEITEYPQCQPNGYYTPLEYYSHSSGCRPVHHNLSIKEAIECRRYDIVQRMLRDPHCCDDPNEEILFMNVYMTGLEYSVYNHDWRMAIIYSLYAADPIYNCFDGRVIENIVHDMRTLDDRSTNYLGDIYDPRFTTTPNLYHLSENNGMPISGFKGLYCLLNPTREKYHEVLATLWIMEQCYGDSGSAKVESIDMVRYARDAMSQIGAKSVWNIEFCQRIYTIMHCLRKVHRESGNVGLPNEICLNILEYMVDDVLSFTLWKGLKYVAELTVSAMTQY